jgi:dTMP kinase
VARGGKLIVFEGPEGVGKTTQVLRLAEHLEAVGLPHVVFREPGGTRVGEQIRALLLDPAHDVHPRAEALLFLAARAQLMHTIRDRMALGEVVLLDRFFLSTYAYQIAGRNLPEEAVRAANQFATIGLVPDLTLLLVYPFGAGLARVERRGERDRMERAGLDFHERVSEAFADFTDPSWQEAHPESGEIMKIDARGTVEEVFARTIEVLGECWPETFGRGPRGGG